MSTTQTTLHAKALLFDSDGVLVDSHEMVEQAWAAVAREFSLDFDVLLAELAGVRAIDTLRKYLSEPSLGTAVAHLEKIEIELAPAMFLGASLTPNHFL